MLKSLIQYFLKPLARVLWSTVISIFTLNFKELYANLFFRLPFVLIIGPQPFLQLFWLKWYQVSDLIQMNVFGVFDPASTIRRMVKNFLCPKDVVVLYDEYLKTPEFRTKQIKFSLQ